MATRTPLTNVVDLTNPILAGCAVGALALGIWKALDSRKRPRTLADAAEGFQAYLQLPEAEKVRVRRQFTEKERLLRRGSMFFGLGEGISLGSVITILFLGLSNTLLYLPPVLIFVPITGLCISLLDGVYNYWFSRAA